MEPCGAPFLALSDAWRLTGSVRHLLGARDDAGNVMPVAGKLSLCMVNGTSPVDAIVVRIRTVLSSPLLERQEYIKARGRGKRNLLMLLLGYLKALWISDRYLYFYVCATRL